MSVATARVGAGASTPTIVGGWRSLVRVASRILSGPRPPAPGIQRTADHRQGRAAEAGLSTGSMRSRLASGSWRSACRRAPAEPGANVWLSADSVRSAFGSPHQLAAEHRRSLVVEVWLSGRLDVVGCRFPTSACGRTPPEPGCEGAVRLRLLNQPAAGHRGSRVVEVWLSAGLVRLASGSRRQLAAGHRAGRAARGMVALQIPRLASGSRHQLAVGHRGSRVAEVWLSADSAPLAWPSAPDKQPVAGHRQSRGAKGVVARRFLAVGLWLPTISLPGHR